MTKVLFFNKVAHGLTRKANVFPIQRAGYCSKVTRPPVLLLGACYLRPAAKDALYHGIEDLKLRGYNAFMEEGIKGGNTLPEALANLEEMKKTMEDNLFTQNPALIALLDRRCQLTQADFENNCKSLLKHFKLSTKNTTTLIGYISRYFASDIAVYERLMTMGFSYENLDKNFSASIFRPLAGRRDLNFRDEQYANLISQAYTQGKNVVSILGALHVLPDSDKINFLTDKIFGPRQLMGERLHERGIPSITLYPFNSSHTTANDYCAAWEKEICYDPQAANPSKAYAIDINGSQGMEKFLNVVDALSTIPNNQTEEETHPQTNCNRP